MQNFETLRFWSLHGETVLKFLFALWGGTVIVPSIIARAVWQETRRISLPVVVAYVFVFLFLVASWFAFHWTPYFNYQPSLFSNYHYFGETKGDMASGKGLLFDEKKRLAYDGEFEKGVRSGYGVFYYENGERYEGNWVNGRREGHGVQYYADSLNKKPENVRISYDGDWRRDMRDGQGTMVWKDGSKYVGGYKNDNRDGKGRHYDPITNLWTDQVWKEGKQIK